MNDKLQKKFQEAEDEVADEIVQSRSESHNDAARMRAMFILGGVTVAKKVAASLNAEAIKTLSRFQEQKMHEDLGYATFVDFLTESEYSPLTKTQFYEGKALLEKEGDELFDMLTDLGISIRKRKLLGKGNIELLGDTLVVHDDDGITEIDIHDRASILDAITALADANAEKAVKLTVQKEKIDKHDDKVREIYAELDTVKASKLADIASNPHMLARVEAGLAIRRLADAAAALSPIEKDQFRDAVLEDFAAWRTNLATSYETGNAVHSRSVELKGDDLSSALDNFLDGVDLDTVGNNDGDLADQL